MKLANWFKIAWWVLLVSSLSCFLYERYPDLVKGNSSYADVIVFLVWIALLLAPLYQEVSFFGLTFKKEIEKLKKEVKGDLAEIRNDIQNSIDVRNHFNPNIMFGVPPQDSQLPAIEEKVKSVLDEFINTHNLRISEQTETTLNVDDDVSYLFSARYNIEKELRRIWSEQYGEGKARGPVPINKMSNLLIQEELLDPRIIDVIREVYSAASPAIHGEKVTKAQIAFVRDVAPNLIAALRSV